MQFDRVAEIRIGPPGSAGTLVRDNRIAFRVTKTDKASANELEVEVYNLAASTRSKLESTDNVVTVAAGYSRDVVRVVGIGDVSKYETEYQAPDMITRLSAGDGLRALRDTRVTLAYESGVSAQRIINDIADKLTLGVRPTTADLSGSYRQGFAFGGPAKEALDSVTRRFGLDWSIQNMELQIVAAREATNREVVVISPDTGLIGSPQKLDDLGENLSEAKEPSGYALQTLLNPRIEPGNRVIVESREIDRREFRVKAVEHTGDTRGDEWASRMEVVEL